MAKTSIASKVTAEDLSGVTIQFSNGNTLAAQLSALSPEIVTHLALHGLSQKLGDSYAGEKDVTVAEGKAAKVLERLVAGDWKAVREGGGSRITDLAKALANVTGRELAEAVDVIESMDKDQKKALRAHAQIKAELAKIAAARAAEAAKDADKEAQELPDLGAMFG